MNSSLTLNSHGATRLRTQTSLQAGDALDDRRFSSLRSKAVLDGCKWDPQVGDASTLASFPLLISREEWSRLSQWAEQLTSEAEAAERELIIDAPYLLNRLGLPRAVRQGLHGTLPFTPAALRWLRFDFHFTDEGWRISEANSDVPGGFTESSFFTQLISEHVRGAVPAGDPAKEWADALADTAGYGKIGLVAAPGYMEDQQIVAYMARLLRARGCSAFLAHPAQICWRDGIAYPHSREGEPFRALVRFFQGEWLANLPSRCRWRHFFRGGRTPVANPGIAVITESKRFPVVWPELKTPMPAWHLLLPETRDPRDAPWTSNNQWLLKTAMCNTGDTVSIRSCMPAQKWNRLKWDVRLNRRSWVAQRRFQTLPLDTPIGAMYPCIGVYTVNGRACGAYARLSRTEIVDYAAVDVALLVED